MLNGIQLSGSIALHPALRHENTLSILPTRRNGLATQPGTGSNA
jgi:hypothetical protein